MEITLLIKSVMGLIAILALLIFFLFLPAHKEKKRKRVAAKKTEIIEKSIQNTDLEYLKNIIKNKLSSTKELGDALDLIIKYHGKIDKKLGIRTHPNFDIYMKILFSLCRHPNADKNIIIKFDKELKKLNQEYTYEINESITKGLNSRRV